jgi:hypothetical protein
MAAEDHGLYGQEQRLDAQDHRVHDAHRVDGMERDPTDSTSVCPGPVMKGGKCWVAAGCNDSDKGGSPRNLRVILWR